MALDLVLTVYAPAPDRVPHMGLSAPTPEQRLSRALQRFHEARSEARESPMPLTRARQWRALYQLILARGAARGMRWRDADRARRCLQRAEAAAGLGAPR